MLIGIVSDVHANLPALSAVLQDMGAVDQLWCLGDIVGYGPYPEECLSELRARSCQAIGGNHDYGCAGKIDLEDFNSDARWACEWARSAVSSDSLAYLAELPVTLTAGDFTLAHGTPREPIWEYMAHASMARLNFHYFASRYCLVGHTHVPLVFVDRGPEPETLHPEADSSLQLGSTRAIVNPGSVGQPRDGNPQASYCLLDTGEATMQFRRVPYDIEAIQERMRRLDFPARLIKRLAYGW